jgi:hypothetical protein
MKLSVIEFIASVSSVANDLFNGVGWLSVCTETAEMDRGINEDWCETKLREVFLGVLHIKPDLGAYRWWHNFWYKCYLSIMLEVEIWTRIGERLSPGKYFNCDYRACLQANIYKMT